MAFTFNFTVDKLAACGIHDAASWFTPLSVSLPLNKIVSAEEVAEFLAQTAHESTNYSQLQENLNYGAPGLHATFPGAFPTLQSAMPYSRQPEKIANRVYANKMGNGDESSGDGWKFRGRGILQVTGRWSYNACSQAVYKDGRLLANPDLLSTPQGAVDSACWFWTSHNLTSLTDAGNLAGVTRRINPALLGETEREANYYKFLNILNA